MRIVNRALGALALQLLTPTMAQTGSALARSAAAPSGARMTATRWRALRPTDEVIKRFDETAQRRRP